MEFPSIYRGLFKLCEFMQNSLKCTDVCVLVCVLVLVVVIMSSDAHYASCKLPVLDSPIPSLAASLTPLPESLYGYISGWDTLMS